MADAQKTTIEAGLLPFEAQAKAAADMERAKQPGFQPGGGFPQ